MASSEQTRSQRTPDEVRRELERARMALSDSVHDLRREVALSTDWRQWVQKRPVAAITGAFVLGYLLGRR